ncbi:MAG: helix-turn-helix domain-containing protein [Paracoccaceae bacterium]
MSALIATGDIRARLLPGPHAEPLKRLLWHETAASRILEATHAIQSDLARPPVAGNLGQQAGMSSPAFLEHFKAVTGIFPLQHQKDLRLMRARKNLWQTNAKVSEIAFAVGQESSALFQREYAQKFGVPPRQHRSLHAAE